MNDDNTLPGLTLPSTKMLALATLALSALGGGLIYSSQSGDGKNNNSDVFLGIGIFCIAAATALGALTLKSHLDNRESNTSETITTRPPDVVISKADDNQEDTTSESSQNSEGYSPTSKGG